MRVAIARRAPAAKRASDAHTFQSNFVAHIIHSHSCKPHSTSRSRAQTLRASFCHRDLRVATCSHDLRHQLSPVPAIPGCQWSGQRWRRQVLNASGTRGKEV